MSARNGTTPTFTAQQVEEAVTTHQRLKAELQAAQVAHGVALTPETKQAQRDALVAFDNHYANSRSVLRVAYQAGMLR